MYGISTSARCSSKLKRRRVDAIREFPKVCGIFPVVMDSRDGEDYIVDHVQPPQNPVTQAARRKYPPPRILKGSSVQRDFPSGFGRRDLHSASKVCLPNDVSAAKPVQKASVETAVKKSHPPGIVTDFSARQVCSAVKQNLFSVSHDISSHGCGKQNSFVSQENASENSYAGNQNLGSVSKKIFAQNKKKSIVADFRSMRSDGTLGNNETGGHRGSSASCDKVKEVLRLFHLTLAKLSKENLAKPKMERDYNVPRKAAIRIKDHQKWIDTSKRVGPVLGVNIGDKFRFQAELNVIGLHCHFYNGIDYMKKNGISLATSIVVSERYPNNMESCDVLIYSGHGGNPTVRGRQAVKDQKLQLGNLALKHSMDRKTPVRVIYKVKLKSSKTFSLKGTGWSKNLNPIFVYDGLYIVEEFWEERGEFGKLVFKFKLKRNLDQPKLPQRLEKKLLLSR
jgi:euchromatic histone-lysine N-methyltransferase